MVLSEKVPKQTMQTKKKKANRLRRVKLAGPRGDDVRKGNKRGNGEEGKSRRVENIRKLKE